MSTMDQLLRQRETRGVTVACEYCGNTFRRMKWELRPGKMIFCSRKCSWRGVAVSRGSGTAERFFQRVNKNGKIVRPNLGACWEWLGGRNQDNYGILRYNGKNWLAHRVAFVLAGNTIPPGYCVLHKCDNRSCVRTDHLFTGTRADNAFDAMLKGRFQKKPWLGNHPNARLTKKEVTAIRRLYSRGWRQIDLAKKFKTGQPHISRIIRKESWQWIP